MLESKTISIKCPYCGKSHTYNLEVRISRVIGLMTLSAMEDKPKGFTRLFMCPVTSKDFQYRFVLKESGLEKIESVKVKGVVKSK